MSRMISQLDLGVPTNEDIDRLAAEAVGYISQLCSDHVYQSAGFASEWRDKLLPTIDVANKTISQANRRYTTSLY